jgi:phosphoethanolamine N-methyltransferase
MAVHSSAQTASPGATAPRRISPIGPYSLLGGNKKNGSWPKMHSMDDPTPQKVYGNVNVEVARLIGRQFFNAIGPTELELIGQEIALRPERSLLDIGAGNANVSVWLANRFGAHVVGLEPSEAMVDEARLNVAQATLQDQIEIVQSDFLAWDLNHHAAGVYDAVIGIDTFCYFADKAQLFGRLAARLKNTARLAFTDLFVTKSETDELLQAYLRRYALALPLRFEAYRGAILSEGFALIRFEDVTPKFRQHWQWVNAQVAEHRSQIVRVLSQDAYEAYQQSSSALLAAAEAGSVGYLLGIAEKVSKRPPGQTPMAS